MTKGEISKLKKFRQIIVKEIDHSKECMEKCTDDEKSHEFWKGAFVEAQELLDKFDQGFPELALADEQ